MSALTDYIAKQKEHNTAQATAIDELNTSLGGVAGDVEGLKKRIDDLINNSGGDITPEVKAELEALLADADAVTNKLKAVAGTAKALDDATPPVAPVPPP